jgi:hypothetical protein
MRALVVVAALALAACVGEVQDRSSRGIKPIVNGTESPEDEAVVALYIGDSFCTGTLVAPRVVLTAAHCLLDVGSATDVQVHFGPSMYDDGMTLAVVDGGPHPDGGADPTGYDVAVLALAEEAPVAPALLNAMAFDNGFVGEPLRLVGYGTTDPYGEPDGLKRQTVTRVTAYSDNEMAFGGTGTSSCYGDSGGPAFMTLEGQEVLVGVTSHGDDDCTAGFNSRVDIFLDDFIQPFIDANGGPGDGTPPAPLPGDDDPAGGDCGSITYDGTCDGDVLSYCEAGSLRSYPCDACACGDDGWCDCVEAGADPGGGDEPLPGGDDCDGIDYYGACEGDMLLWCNEGQLEMVDCAGYDSFCIYQDDSIGYNCL